MWGTGQVAADGFLGCWMRLGRERLQLPPCPSVKKKQAQVSLFPHCGGWDLGGGRASKACGQEQAGSSIPPPR